MTRKRQEKFILESDYLRGCVIDLARLETRMRCSECSPSFHALFVRPKVRVVFQTRVWASRVDFFGILDSWGFQESQMQLIDSVKEDINCLHDKVSSQL